MYIYCSVLAVVCVSSLVHVGCPLHHEIMHDSLFAAAGLVLLVVREHVYV